MIDAADDAAFAAELQDALYRLFIDKPVQTREEVVASVLDFVRPRLPEPESDGTFWYEGRMLKIGPPRTPRCKRFPFRSSNSLHLHSHCT